MLGILTPHLPVESIVEKERRANRQSRLPSSCVNGLDSRVGGYGRAYRIGKGQGSMGQQAISFHSEAAQWTQNIHGNRHLPTDGLQQLNVHTITRSAALKRGLAGLAADESAGPCQFSFSGIEQGLEPLMAPGIDAIIIDIGSGAPAEIAFLRRVVSIGPDAPVIALGFDDPALQTEAMKAGADDCIGVTDNAPRIAAMAVRRAVIRRNRDDEPRAAPVTDAPGLTLVQESAEAIVILDSDGLVQFMNDAAEEILGCKAGELQGKPFDLPSEPGEHDVKVNRPDGDLRFAEMRVVDTQWGGVPARVAALTDTTVRRALQHTLKSAEAETEDVRRRNQSFFSNVNHDLRTPLTHIIGFSELMKNEQLGPLGEGRYREYAQDIHSSGTMLLDMIEDLLGIAEAETDRIDLTNEICSVAQLVEIAMTSQRNNARAEGVALELETAARLPGLRGDQKRLRQGFFRLISEAIHCAHRGATLNMRIEETDKGLEVVLEEKHDWSGQARFSEMDSAEDPFVSAEDSSTPRPESLALSLTRKVMEMHEGSLQVDGGRGLDGEQRLMRIVLTFPPDRLI
jgi:signal transduction histidine kinase